MDVILRIAVPSPLRRLFDYLSPATCDTPLRVGQRLLVPFGRHEVVGILVAITEQSEVAKDKLKPATRQLDDQPAVPEEIMRLLMWASAYYHHPPGEVFHTALPAMLRQGKAVALRGLRHWRITPQGVIQAADGIARAPRQTQLLKLLQEYHDGLDASRLGERLEHWQAPMRRLVEQGWVAVSETACLIEPLADNSGGPVNLNADQASAVDAFIASSGAFQAFLLDGVTGSGKTEVYLNTIAHTLAQGKQALVLVPEIGLTPQLVERFRRRFNAPIALIHSGLSDSERLCAWTQAGNGNAPIIIGTRSAVFTPLARPGIIIIDEEHDASFKQQDGFRYSARDVALVRAQRQGITIMLGSATPSLESLHNVNQGRYRRLCLPQRAGRASQPKLHLLDVRHLPLEDGLSRPLVAAMQRHLTAGGQVMLFLNRRGYAPTLLCHDCGWVGHCQRCDAHMTLYAGNRRLRCHHCGAERPVYPQCPDCGSLDLRPVGQGTERIEQALQNRFPEQAIVRIDRDSTRRKGALEDMLEAIHKGESRLLIGTQMLAKGHHFPDVTLVGILDADQGLFSADFRAPERMAQLILQVAGRAGREEKPGEVVIQTHAPDHPLLRLLVEKDYAAFAEATLAERQSANLPPYSHMALLRAEAVDRESPNDFLEAARQLAQAIGTQGVELYGPIPAPMERRAGRNRAQLMLMADQRADLHRLLTAWLPGLETMRAGRKVRWSLDVDPQETY